MNTTKPKGRNWSGRHTSYLLPDEQRCRFQKNYGLTCCNDVATVDITDEPPRGYEAKAYGFCAFHAAFTIKRIKKNGTLISVVER